jgi:hypothetical protein
MIELTGMGSVLRGIGVLYWLLAVGAISLALIKGKTLRAKVIWTTVALMVFGFLPGKAMIEQYQRDAYAKEAWAYFKKKCDTEAGEKIYKTFTGVKSVLVVKPLPPASDKDNYDQFWYGDPYSGAPTSKRSESAAVRLVMNWRNRLGTGSQRGLDFVEIKNESSKGYTRIYRPESNDKFAVREQITRPASSFGVTWEDISTPEDRRYWVAGSRFRIIDLADNSIVAERIGFLVEAGFGSTSGGRRPWSTALGIGPNGRSCPYSGDPTDQWFITNVFKQEGEK